jgi:anti-sigma factor RsiW
MMEHLSDEQLDDFLAGAGSPSERDAVHAHLADCRSCAQRHRELLTLLEQLLEQCQDEQPRADLFPAIRQAIEGRSTAQEIARPSAPSQQARRAGRRRAAPLWALAASLLLTTTLGSWFFLSRPTPAPGWVSAGGGASLPEELERATRQLDEAAGELERELSKHAQGLSPAARRDLDEAMQALRRALRDERNALASPAGETSLGAQRLVWLGEQRLALLQGLLAASRTSAKGGGS